MELTKDRQVVNEDRVFGHELVRWCMYLLMAFPIVDYTLRLLF